jgi:hypothetical protein
MSESINLLKRLYLRDGEIYPITTLIDENGDDAEEWNAVVVVAGRDECWFVVDLRDFEPTSVN